MEKSVTIDFGDNFIEQLSKFLLKEFPNNNDFSRIACVFGGKRPGLFLKRQLAQEIGGSYLPPVIFSMDDFIDYLAFGNKPIKKLIDLDACFLIYSLAKKHAPQILRSRESFSEFLPWAREVVSFIEQLDLEDISPEKLSGIQKSAAIGFEIPENINELLRHIIKLRRLYHQELEKAQAYSRGLRYLKAQSAGLEGLSDYDAVIFCNFFYLHKTESQIIKSILESGKGCCVFQGSSKDWPVLAKTSQSLNLPSLPTNDYRPMTNDLFLYQGFDMHSQVCLASDIVKKISDKENTVIVLPRPESAIPLLSETASHLKEFNISLGYPLSRSVLFALFDSLAKSRASKKDDKYYAKDYLEVLRNPLVKNLQLGAESGVSRVLVHKIEELLQGKEKSLISGSLFVSLDEIENEPQVYALSVQTISSMGIKADSDDCVKVLKQLHDILFRAWDGLDDFESFSRALAELLDVLIAKSMLSSFPFNIKAMEKLLSISDELSLAGFKSEKFPHDDIWQIFLQQIQSEMISFSGSPLRGTQILGLLETRSLNFDNVIVLDLNEGVFPKLKLYEPLIPREVMLSLGLNRLEKEEEIQRYQFKRLISGAKNVHLIYEANQEKEKSRFIEELLWEKQQEEKKLDVFNIPRLSFQMGLEVKDFKAIKTPLMMEYLKNQTYSASRLNKYLECPMKFYFQYVLGLDEKDDLLDEPEAASIGTFVHKLLDETFRVFVGKKPVIDLDFKKYFQKTMEKNFNEQIRKRMKSDAFLLWGIVTDRMDKFLDNEAGRDVAKIISLETEVVREMVIGDRAYKFKYSADRVDELSDGSILIIDYKTGSTDKLPKNFSALSKMELIRSGIKDDLKSFQLPIYYHFISRDFPGKKVNAALYGLKTMQMSEFMRPEEEKKDELMGICYKALETIIAEIENPDILFEADQEAKCEYCPFKAMCN